MEVDNLLDDDHLMFEKSGKSNLEWGDEYLDYGDDDNEMFHVSAIEVHAASKRAKLPKMTSVDAVFYWIEQVTSHILLVGKTGMDTSTQEDWATSVIAGIIDRDDPQVYEFRRELEAYPFPSHNKIEILVIYDGEMPTDEILRKKAQGVGRYEEVIVPEGLKGTKIHRPMMVWEWLEDFVTIKWLNQERKQHYRTILKHLRFQKAPKLSTLGVVMIHLAKHVRTVQEYFRLAMIAKDDEKEYFCTTFGNDSELAKIVNRSVNFDQAHRKIRNELSGRYRISQPNEGNASVSEIGTEDPQQSLKEVISSLKIEMIEMMEARFPARNSRQSERSQKWERNRPSRNQDGNRGQQGGRYQQGGQSQQNGRNHKGPYQSKGNGRSSNTVAASKTSQPTRCFHCAKIGHMKPECPIGKKPSPIPPLPEGKGWGKHFREYVDSLNE